MENQSETNHLCTSLYVGDLGLDVTEAMLFDKFSPVGPIVSIRVCRDIVTRYSLGYAYINFRHPSAAETALNTMNFDELNGRSMRIMWPQRNPLLRKLGVGNIFIKNLEETIDSKSIYDTFSAFGNILSCKVAEDGTGKSKGYGFVHFETKEAAAKAIERVNGMLLNGKKVFVGPFVDRKLRERQLGLDGKCFKNIYIKNFGEDFDNDKLLEMFSKYGTVTSHKVMLDDEGKSRGFGFVCYENSDAAVQACAEMHDKVLNGKTLFVNRAQRRGERQAELHLKFQQIKMDLMNRRQGVNLYVKNLDESIDDDQLRKEFASYGTITSAKVMMDSVRQTSQGFGFVCFSTPEEATKALTEMNGFMLMSKPLYVSLAQQKEHRKALLASQFMTRLTAMQMQHMRTVYPPGSYFAPPMHAGVVLAHPTHNARQVRVAGSLPAVTMQQHAALIANNRPLTMSMLESVAPQDQKRILGRCLFPIIQRIYPNLANQLTAVLLQHDNSELLHILEHNESLETKLNEAMTVLDNSTAKS